MVRDVLICHYNYFVTQSHKRIFVMVLAAHLQFVISLPATDNLLLFSFFFIFFLGGGGGGGGVHMCTYFDLYVEQCIDC
jgi:hypothetical protein